MILTCHWKNSDPNICNVDVQEDGFASSPSQTARAGTVIYLWKSVSNSEILEVARDFSSSSVQENYFAFLPFQSARAGVLHSKVFPYQKTWGLFGFFSKGWEGVSPNPKGVCHKKKIFLDISTHRGGGLIQSE